MPFEFKEVGLKGVKVIEPEVFEDGRGFFLETYVKEDFKEAGIDADFVQDNHSRSEKGVLRGLHYQKGEHAQAKLVRCTKGKILDIAVDLRRDSETFGQHFSIELSKENRKMLYMPSGFAHGFLTLRDVAEVQYKVDNDYAPDKEAGIIWDDPHLHIEWPVDNPALSEKDRNWPSIQTAKKKGLLF